MSLPPFLLMLEVMSDRALSTIKMLSTATQEGEDNYEWNDVEQLSSASDEPDLNLNGTVFQRRDSLTESPNIKLNLNDLFEQQDSNNLSEIFKRPSTAARISSKQMFAAKHDTLTKSKLKGILASLDDSFGSLKPKKLFEWPANSQDKGHEEEYPVHIDFLDDLDDLHKKEKDQEQVLKRPQSAPKKFVGLQESLNGYPDDIDFADEMDLVMELDDEKVMEKLEMEDLGSQPPRRPRTAPQKQEKQDKYQESKQKNSISVSNLQIPNSSIFEHKLSRIQNDLTYEDPNYTNDPLVVTEEAQRTPYFAAKKPTLTPHKPGSNVLDLTNHQLRSIAEFKIEGSLYTKYKLNFNRLEFLDDLQQSAQSLFVTNNLLSDMTSFSHLNMLCILDISHNKLSDLSAISSLVLLKELKATDNLITAVSSISNLSNLVYLDLTNNFIENVDFRAISSFRRLYTLNLSGNQITIISNIHKLSHLHELFLEENSLQSIVFAKPMKRLKVINLNDNALVQFDAANLSALSTLFLDRNRLVEINGLGNSMSRLDIFSAEDQESLELAISNTNAIDAEEVRLCGTGLKNWSAELCKNVESFDASNCKLFEIPLTLFNSPNLRNLSISFNDLTSLIPIKVLKNLKVLIVSHNKLYDINSVTEVVSGLPHLSILDIRHNLFVSATVDRAQIEVSEIVIKSCIVLACKKLQTLNQNPVTASDRKKAGRRMKALKNIAREYALKTQRKEFDNWSPNFQPLADMTAGEDLVLEFI